MNLQKLNICHLCLNTISDGSCQTINHKLRNDLKVHFLCDLKDTIICSDCSEKSKGLSGFISIFLNSQSVLTDVTSPDEYPICLRDVFFKVNHDKLKATLTDKDQVCFFCLSHVSGGIRKFYGGDETILVRYLRKCRIMLVGLNAIKEPVTCEQCYLFLKMLYNFTKNNFFKEDLENNIANTSKQNDSSVLNPTPSEAERSGVSLKIGKGLFDEAKFSNWKQQSEIGEIDGPSSKLPDVSINGKSFRTEKDTFDEEFSNQKRQNEISEPEIVNSNGKGIFYGMEKVLIGKEEQQVRPEDEDNRLSLEIEKNLFYRKKFLNQSLERKIVEPEVLAPKLPEISDDEMAPGIEKDHSDTEEFADLEEQNEIDEHEVSNSELPEVSSSGMSLGMVEESFDKEQMSEQERQKMINKVLKTFDICDDLVEDFDSIPDEANGRKRKFTDVSFGGETSQYAMDEELQKRKINMERRWEIVQRSYEFRTELFGNGTEELEVRRFLSLGGSNLPSLTNRHHMPYKVLETADKMSQIEARRSETLKRLRKSKSKYKAEAKKLERELKIHKDKLKMIERMEAEVEKWYKHKMIEVIEVKRN